MRLKQTYFPWVVLLFAIGLYSGTFFHDYNMSDELVTLNHRNTSRGLSAFQDIVNEFYYEDEMGYKYGYRPVTHLSFALEHQLFGESPGVSHAVNVLLYGLLCLLVFYLIKQLLPSYPPWLWLAGALLFATHPIHTEVVASIKNRDEILSLLFGLGALLAVFRLRNSKIPLPLLLGWILVCIGCFALSYYSKKSGLHLALLLPFIVIYNRKDESYHYPKLVSAVLLGLLTSFLSIQGFITWPLTIAITAVYTLLIYLQFIVKKVVIWLKKEISVITLGVCTLIFAAIGGYYDHPDAAILCFLLFSFRLKKGAIPVKYLVYYSIVFYLSISVPYLLFYSGETGIIDLLLNPILIFLVVTAIWKNHWLFLLSFVGVLGNLDAWSLLLALGFLLLLILLVQNKRGLPISYSWSRHLPKYILILSLVSCTHLLLQPEYYQEQTSQNASWVDNRDTEPLEVADVLSLEVNQEGTNRPITYIENPLVENWTIQNRLQFAYHSTAFYLKKLCFPYPLLYYYGFDQIDYLSPPLWLVIVDLSLLLLVLTSIIFCFIHRRFKIVLALLFLILPLVPYANFFIPIAGIVGERLAFQASLGFVLLETLWIYLMWNNQKVIAKISFIFLVVLYTGYTSVRSLDWKNSYTLFSADIRYLKNSSVANSMVGELYLSKANSYKNPNNDERKSALETSIKHFNQAISIYDKFHNDFYHLGVAYYLQGDFTSAQNAFMRSYAIDSNYDPSPYYNMAKWAIDEQQDSIAIYNLNKYIELVHHDEQAHFELLKLYFDNSKNDMAYGLLLKMEKRFPNNLLVYYNLYEISRSMGLDSAATTYYNLGVEIDEFYMNSLLSQ